MSIGLPIFAFVFGWVVQKKFLATKYKKLLSLALARCFIPFVIAYNMLFYQASSFLLILFSFISSVVVYLICAMLFKDRLIALCASYSNIGWLGFPLALLIFGQSVSASVIALYVGSSIFGNIWAIPAVSQIQPKWLYIVKRVLKAPPTVALCIAFILRFFSVHTLISGQWWLLGLYAFAKYAMVFAGMAILGMWLSQTQITIQDLKDSTRVMLVKLAIGIVLCIAVYNLIADMFIQQHIALLLFLFILPPAANIVALETHYQNTGRSAAYIAAGTIVSIVMIGMFALIYLPLH